MLEKLRLRNYSAIGLLVVGKLFGIAGLVVGSSSRVLGGTLLAIDGVLITMAVLVAVRAMKARAQEDTGEKAVLRQMMKEGTLKQYLRDIEAEDAASKTGVGAPEPAERVDDEPQKRTA